MERRKLTKEERVKRFREYIAILKSFNDLRDSGAISFDTLFGDWVIDGEKINYNSYYEIGGQTRTGAQRINEYLRAKTRMDKTLNYYYQVVKTVINDKEVPESEINEYKQLILKLCERNLDEDAKIEEDIKDVQEFLQCLHKMLAFRGTNGFEFKTFNGVFVINGKEVEKKRTYEINGQKVSGERIINDYLKANFGLKKYLSTYLDRFNRLKATNNLPKDLSDEFDEIVKQMENFSLSTQIAKENARNKKSKEKINLIKIKNYDENAKEVLEQIVKLFASQNENFHFTGLFGKYTINGEEFNCAYDYVGENGEKVRGVNIVQDIIKEVLGIDYNLLQRISTIEKNIRRGVVSPKIVDEFRKYGLLKDRCCWSSENNEDMVNEFIAGMDNIIQHNGKGGFLFKTLTGPVVINNVQYSRNVKYKHNGKENVSGKKIIDDYLKEQFGFKYNLEAYMNVIQRMKRERIMPAKLNKEIEKIYKKLNDKVNEILDKEKQEKLEERKILKKERKAKNQGQEGQTDC